MSVEVRLTEWRPGAAKVAAVGLLKWYCDLDLSDAKSLVDELLEGRSASVRVSDRTEADRMLRELAKIGFHGHVVDTSPT